MRSGAAPGNIYAPAWLAGPGPTDPPMGSARNYIVPFSLSGTDSSDSAELVLDGGANWHWYSVAWAFDLAALTSDGNVAVRIRLPGGSFLSDDLIYVADLAGPLFPAMPIRSGGTMAFTFRLLDDTADGDFTGWLWLKGWKR